jgi:hypothetical protein
VSAIAVYVAAVLTLGIGFLLFPVALALNGLAFRRTARPRGFIFWLGSLASGVVTVVGLVVLALVVLVTMGLI